MRQVLAEKVMYDNQEVNQIMYDLLMLMCGSRNNNWPKYMILSLHISNIYKDNELDKNRTNKKFLLVR